MYCERPLGAQVVLGLLLGVVAILTFGMSISTASDKDYSHLPTLTREQVHERYRALMERVSGPVSDDPREYFRVYVDSIAFSSLQAKYLEESDANNMVTSYPLTPDLGDLQLRYNIKFGREAMGSLSQRLRPWIDAQMAHYEGAPVPGSNERAWAIFLWGALVSIVLAFLFLLTRLRDERLFIMPELIMGRIFLAALTWPVALWLYPRIVNPVTQMRRMKQFLAGLISSGLAFASASAAYASDRRNEQGTDNPSTTLVVREGPRPAYSLSAGVMFEKLAMNGMRGHAGPVAWASASTSYDGWTIEIAGTRSLTGSNASDENDLIVSRRFEAGAWSVTARLAYYDIQPLARTDGGDIVSPVLYVERPIADHVTGFIQAEAYFLTGGAPGRNGFDAMAGVSMSHEVAGVTIDLRTSAIYADGPFGFDAGVSLRQDVAARVPLSDRITAIFSMKGFMPIIGALDREPRLSANMGLALAF